MSVFRRLFRSPLCLAFLIALLALCLAQPARADGGGWPTSTSTPTPVRTATPTTVTIVTPTLGSQSQAIQPSPLPGASATPTSLTESLLVPVVAQSSPTPVPQAGPRGQSILSLWPVFLAFIITALIGLFWLRRRLASSSEE